MDIHNFQLSDIFQQNAKEYVTRPVRAMKYQPGLGIENGFCVHYSSTEAHNREYMMYVQFLLQKRSHSQNHDF